LTAVAQRAAAAHDEEHLLLAAMAVERARALARRNDVVRVAEILCAEQRAHAREARLVLRALLEMLQLQLVDVDDFRIDHGHGDSAAACRRRNLPRMIPVSGRGGS